MVFQINPYISMLGFKADIGTRKGTQLKDIGPEAEWINGYTWMKNNVDEMPIKAIKSI